MILLRRDSFLDTVKSGVTQDTLNRLRGSSLHSEWLFDDHALSKAEEEIKTAEQKPASSRPASSSSSNRNQGWYHPYKDQGQKGNQHGHKDRPKSDAWKSYGRRDSRAQPKSTVTKQAKSSKSHK